MTSGVAPDVCTGNPNTGVRTSGTTSASGGILGNDSFLGPPQAEHDSATGVLRSVQRGQAQPKWCPSRPPTSPLLSDRRNPSSLTACCPWGSSSTVGVTLGVGGSAGAGGRPLAVAAMVVVGGVGVAEDCPKPQTEQAPDPCGLLRVQRGQAQRCSSVLLSRRIWLRSGFWRGASQMEQRGAAPAFKKVQRPHDHSLPRTAAMDPGE